MIPATLQFIIAMIASAINERMQRKLDYVQEEVRVLKEVVLATTGSARISFTAGQRRRLALAGKELSPQERRKYCQLVTPATLLAWFRSLGARKYDSPAGRKRGRPRKARDIRKLVIRMAQANLSWGYTKIRDALRTGLKIEIGRTTVANILADAGIEPAPEREQRRTWMRFMKMHWETLYACDFFSVEVLGIFGTVRYMVFFVMEVKTRAVEIAGIQVDPGGEWMKQVARNLTDPGLSQNLIEARSGRGPMIEIQQAAEPLAPLHSAVLIRRFRRSREQHIAKTLVVPFAVVVGEVLHDGPPEMSFPQRHDPVQAFAFDREHKSLGIGVQVRTPGGQQQRL